MSCLHVCEIMGFMTEDKHLIKCLRVSNRNEYLILTSVESLVNQKHTLKILYKSTHLAPRYKRKREWVFLLSEHQAKTPTRVFFYISVQNVSICTKFLEYVCEDLGIPSKSKLNIHCYSGLANIYQIFIFYRETHYFANI